MWIETLSRRRFRRADSQQRARRLALRPVLEGMDPRIVPAVVNPAGVNAPIDTSLTPHAWTPDSAGLYHTTTDLATEWQGYYATMLAGNGSTLTPVQRLEGNAEAVFENTGLKNLSAAQLVIDREDVQREFDAIASALQTNQQKYGTDPNKPLTDTTYLQLENTLQNNPVLLELAVQGHGLNTPPSPRYNGYTNDFQNNVDQTTLFIGGGLNNNNKAIADFFDDNVLSHVPFNVIWKNGHAVQLNQNGDNEGSIEKEIIALDDELYGRVLKSTDFSTTASTANNHYHPLYSKLVESTKINVNQAPSGGFITTLYGQASTTITIGTHTWTADIYTGIYHTTTDLAAEWKGFYTQMLSGNFGSLTQIQRLEGNAEAVFENTGLAKLTPEQQRVDREDAQREFDAISSALTTNNITGPLTNTTYLQVAQTIQNNATLEELALQGHGLNSFPAVRYVGYTNDFQNNVDQTTTYIGGGLNNNKKAIADFFDDNILSHLPFPVIWRNGKLVQLNQNGAQENTLKQAVTALNNSMFFRVYTSTDFKQVV